jgi:hypothetical protein
VELATLGVPQSALDAATVPSAELTTRGVPQSALDAATVPSAELTTLGVPRPAPGAATVPSAELASESCRPACFVRRAHLIRSWLSPATMTAR